MAASLAQEILQMRNPTPKYCQSHRDGIKYEDPTPDPTRWTISPPVTPKAEEPKAEEPMAEEPKTEEPKTKEPKTEEPKKIFKESVKLDISKEDIGLFVGAKGATIRKYVTEKTQKDLSSPSRIRCSLKANEDGVYAYMKTETEEAMVTMKKFLMKHSESFVKRKKFAGQTRFVFKVPMDHCRIPKFIGTRGKNIKSLKEDIIQEDKNLTEEKIQVQIREDAPMRMKYLRFGVIKVDTESDNEVLITVIIKTNNREESWKIAERLVKEHVEKASKNHHREDDPFEDNGW